MFSTQLDWGDLRELSKELELLSKAENRKVLNKATRAAAAAVTAEAKKRAKVKTGKLKRNIVTLSVKGRSPLEAASGVHVRGRNPRTGNSDNSMKATNPNNAYYWRFIENGTSKMAAQPFIRPAYDAKQAQLEGIIKDTLNKAIDEVLKN